MSEQQQRRLNPARSRPRRRRRVVPPRDPQRERRRKKQLGRWTLISGILVAISIIGAALLSRGGDADAPTVPPPVATLHAADAEQLTLVGVRDVLDGDTLDVDAASTRLRVRLFGVDAPEVGERCAAEATDRLRALAGDTVLLRADLRQQDRFGRELRYVYTVDGGSIDATLVAEGLAVAWRADGAFRDTLITIEEEARASGTGCLWRR